MKMVGWIAATCKSCYDSKKMPNWAFPTILLMQNLFVLFRRKHLRDKVWVWEHGALEIHEGLMDRDKGLIEWAELNEEGTYQYRRAYRSQLAAVGQLDVVLQRFQDIGSAMGMDVA